MSWAYEMENIVLGWYVLVETQSVTLLTLFASMQYFGTLLSPMFGVMGNRLGTKRLMCGMRAVYTLLSAAMLTLVLAGHLSPLYVFIASALLGGALVFAAGVLIVTEAGGFVASIREGNRPLEHGDVIAANSEIFERFSKVIRNQI